MLLGLRSAIYPVEDLARAKAWYTKAFGVKPYFDEPFYVGFNIAGFELGLDPGGKAGKASMPIAYWGVEDVASSHAKLLAVGATEGSSVQDVGGGIRVASVRDPFGNLIGLIENPHFKLP